MKSGVVLVDKRAGMTSAQVVATVKRRLDADRVGHAGTLDPDATGLLICLVQGATRLASVAGSGMKLYAGTIRLGVTTASDDMAGDVLSTFEGELPDSNAVLEAAKKFQGTIQQTPPRVSAVKVKGKRAHALARSGAEFELTPRTVEVRRFTLQYIEPNLFAYEVECSPGTYVRSLARDLGEVLGCGGAIAELRRVSSGALCAASGVLVDDVSWDSVVDWHILFPGTPVIAVGAELATDLLNGKVRALEQLTMRVAEISPRPDQVIYVDTPGGESLGVIAVNPDGTTGFLHNIGRSAAV